MPNLRDEPIATWEQAMDNIRAQQIRLKNNVPFMATGFYYVRDRFITAPAVKLEVDTTGGYSENFIEFKDGSKFGFAYLGTGSGNFFNMRLYMYLTEYEVIGTTETGQPYTWSTDINVINYIEDSDQTATLQLPVTHYALSFGMFLNNDGSVDMSSYDLKYILYPSQASGGGLNWSYNYADAIQWDQRSTFGYREADSHIVDWLCGQYSPPAVYPGDPSGAGGGDGLFYTDDFDMDWPGAPGISALSLGFTSIYVPTPEIAQSIAAWLWSDDFDENIKMNYISPFDNIISLSIVPINANALAMPSFLRIGNVESGIECPKLPATEQYQEINMGTVNVPEKWGSFLDFNAQYYIFLPMIGFRALRPDDMVSGKISVRYWCDMLTGGVTCNIMANKPGEKNHILYSYNGNMLYGVAFSGANFMSQYNQQLSATTSGLNSAVSTATNLASGNLAGALSSLMNIGMAQRQYDTAKPDYGRGGNSGGNMGLFATRYPYLIRIRAIEQTPDHYKHLQGVPSQISAQLSTLSGYTEVDAVVVDTLNCPQEEKEAIFKLLKGGVYL